MSTIGNYLFLMLVILIMWMPSETNADKYCSPDFHKCDEGSKLVCIPHDWVCDGESDCNDHSDEEDCGELQCESDEFNCTNNKQCILSRWRCDGELDCRDGSDERDCGAIICDEYHVSCGEGQMCIPSSFVCDGHRDCLNGFDERNDTCSKARECSETEFKCVQGQRCIYDRWVCDGDLDCEDGSDEVGCDDVTCDENQFKCRNSSHCIPKHWTCDGTFDCADKSDEFLLDCPADGHSCPENEFLCPVSKDCIHVSWLCDSDFDCSDGADEFNCSTQTCKTTEFQCRSSGHCIQNSWKCDSLEQCDDGSDEQDCHIVRPCNAETEFDCNQGKARNRTSNCVPIEKVCDHKNDCGNYEDESICSTTHLCNDTSCGVHGYCKWSNTGKQCTCNSGFKKTPDHKSCEDINECEIISSCSHNCTNKKGGFKCSCNPGYELDIINHTRCLAKGEEPLLLFANHHDVRQIQVHSGGYHSVVNNSKYAKTLDYDAELQQLFVSDAITATISRLQLSRTGAVLKVISSEVVASDLQFVEDLACDWTHKNLYVATGSSVDLVSFQSSNATWRRTLINQADHFRAILVDPRTGHNYLYLATCGSHPSIQRTHLDGSPLDSTSSRPLIDSNMICPTNLAMDFEANTLWWIDSKLHIIVQYNLATRQRDILLTSYTVLKHPLSIDIFEDTVFWTDQQSGMVLKMSRFHRNIGNVSRVATHLTTATDLRVYHKLKQPHSENVCLDSRCSHICLPSQSDAKLYRCLCPNDGNNLTYQLGADGFSCVVSRFDSARIDTMPVSMVNDSKPGHAFMTDGQGHIAIFIILIIASIVAVILLLTYIVMRKYRQQNRKTMNFDNPVYRKKETEDEFQLEKSQFQPSSKRLLNSDLTSPSSIESFTVADHL